MSAIEQLLIGTVRALVAQHGNVDRDGQIVDLDRRWRMLEHGIGDAAGFEREEQLELVAALLAGARS